jgi:hypothetical protein
MYVLTFFCLCTSGSLNEATLSGFEPIVNEGNPTEEMPGHSSGLVLRVQKHQYVELS